MWPLMGIDPVPGRISYPLRLLMLFLMLPFHAIPWHLDHERDHADRGELVSRLQSDLAAQSAG